MKNMPLEACCLQAASQQHHVPAGGSGQAPCLTEAVGLGVKAIDPGARLLGSSLGSATDQPRDFVSSAIKGE